jgi:hypothetical protein
MDITDADLDEILREHDFPPLEDPIALERRTKAQLIALVEDVRRSHKLLFEDVGGFARLNRQLRDEVAMLRRDIDRLEQERMKDEIKHTITWEQYEALRRDYEEFIFTTWRERQKAAGAT